jgi:hypothetical protein
MVWRVRRRPAPAAASRTTVEAAARVEPRAALFGVAAPLLGRRLDLRHEQVVFRPLDGNLLAD